MVCGWREATGPAGQRTNGVFQVISPSRHVIPACLKQVPYGAFGRSSSVAGRLVGT